MEPEASVSALVFHHPDAVYFTATDSGSEAAAASLDSSLCDPDHGTIHMPRRQPDLRRQSRRRDARTNSRASGLPSRWW